MTGTPKARMKAGAVSVVALMLAVSFVSAVPYMGFDWMPDSDAGSSSDYWTYTIALDSSGDATVTGSGTATASPTAAGAAGTTGAYTSSGGANVGSWGFDSKGYGPFGSFYAAYNASDANRMICILNPNNLDQSIDGSITLSTDYSSSKVNVMWVLPTIYWKGDSETGALTLSNDPSSGGTAYAHTIDGHVYEYMAIGVYIGTKATVTVGGTDTTILTSSAGQATTDMTSNKADFRTRAQANVVNTEGSVAPNGKAMLWNFYMWQLYRFTVIATGGGTNSQGIFGNGFSYGNYSEGRSVATGGTSGSGPYAGYVSDPNGTGTDSTHQSSVKAFIENAWGTAQEFVDGALVDSQNNVYASQVSEPVDYDSTIGSEYKKVGTLSGTAGFGMAGTGSDEMWWLPTGAGGTVEAVGDSTLFDYCGAYSGTGILGLTVGGAAYNGSKKAYYSGISFLDCTRVTVKGDASRLAFVFDTSSDYWTYVVSPTGEVKGYGTATADPVAAGAKGTTGKYTSSDGENVGSWGFDAYGYGPFGSFYAAFDASDRNRFLCILNPNNLEYSIGGVPLQRYGDGIKNVMWVLPTIYWSIDSGGNLVLTNNPSGGTAYAHTIDGKVHKYLAIGVYEASTSNIRYSDEAAPSVRLTSEPKTAAVVDNRPTLRGYAEGQTVMTDGATEGKSMLWNFYMWQLYRYTVLTTGGSWHSQAVFGNGNASFASGWDTGSLDSSGPYSGSVGSPDAVAAVGGIHDQSVKAFIENAWGNHDDIVDGVVVRTNSSSTDLDLYVSQLSRTLDNIGGKSYLYTLPTGTPGEVPGRGKFYLGYGRLPLSYSDPASWGLPGGELKDNYDVSDLYDKQTFAANGFDGGTFFGLSVGGSKAASTSVRDVGLSYMSTLSSDSAVTGAGRLAFVFDSDLTPEAKVRVTSVHKSMASGTEVSVLLEIPSTEAPREGDLSIGGVYWITTGEGRSEIRAYGSIATLYDSSLIFAPVEEKGSGMLSVMMTFRLNPKFTIYNVYAEYTAADGHTVRSPLVFAGDGAMEIP